MAILSISLPNNTQITLESDESEVIQDVIGQILRDLPLDSALANLATHDGAQGENGSGEKSKDATDGPVDTTPPRRVNGAATRPGASHEGQTAGVLLNGSSGSPALPFGNENGDQSFDPQSQPRQAREDFTAFCQSLNPMGDMRRVVVAAEAATRFFGLEGVTADDLGELFDLAGWRRANSFTQTLRNAARSKFGWLERIPGRAGRYAATDVGRSITLAG